MALRGEDQFVYMVSSDGCREAYPGNGPSSFKISLKEPIEMEDYEKWEVGLLEVHYPCNWNNMGKETEMCFVLKNGSVRRVNFPEWRCLSVKEVVGHIEREVSGVTDLYSLGMDELGRFYIESKMLHCDVGFSKSLMRLLGISERQYYLKSTECLRRWY